MKKLIILLAIFTTIVVSAQSVGINADGSTADTSAILDVKSTTKGFLPPRMTNTEMINIQTPAQGLIAFCTNCGSNGEYYVYKGTSWGVIGSSNATTVGAVGTTSDAKGAIITSGVLSLTPADVSNPGILTTTAQSITGAKTFSTDLKANGLTMGKGANGVATNTAFGNNALALNASLAIENTAVGYNALASNTTGSWNTANGTSALKSNTTGSENTAIGDETLLINTTGGANSAFGEWALYSNTTGSYNTAIGNAALRGSTGSYNTAIGFGAGSGTGFTGGNVTTGNNNLMIGNSAKSSTLTVSNEITLGNSSITSLRCNAQTITSLSDRRDKTNIIPIGEGLEFLKKLNPVSYTWNTRDKAKVGIKASGFIAQELLALQKQSTIGDNLDLVSENNPEKLEARYGNLLPVIVKAIQEESAEKNKAVQELKTIIDNQQRQIEELKKLVKLLVKK